MSHLGRHLLSSLVVPTAIATAVLALVGIVVSTLLICKAEMFFGTDSRGAKYDIGPFAMKHVSRLGHFCMGLLALAVIALLSVGVFAMMAF